MHLSSDFLYWTNMNQPEQALGAGGALVAPTHTDKALHSAALTCVNRSLQQAPGLLG